MDPKKYARFSSNELRPSPGETGCFAGWNIGNLEGGRRVNAGWAKAARLHRTSAPWIWSRHEFVAGAWLFVYGITKYKQCWDMVGMVGTPYKLTEIDENGPFIDDLPWFTHETWGFSIAMLAIIHVILWNINIILG